MAGLEVKCVFSWDLRRIILKIRCPQCRLEQVAEKMHIKLKNREGAIRRFKVRIQGLGPQSFLPLLYHIHTDCLSNAFTGWYIFCLMH